MPQGVVFPHDQAFTDIRPLKAGFSSALVDALALSKSVSGQIGFDSFLPQPHAHVRRSHHRLGEDPPHLRGNEFAVRSAPAPEVTDRVMEAHIAMFPVSGLWIVLGQVMYSAAPLTGIVALADWGYDTVFLRCFKGSDVSSLPQTIDESWPLLFDMTWWSRYP